MATPVLTEIAAALPTPTLAQVAAVFAAADPNLFAARGRRVSSQRVLTDTSRMYGLAAAFWRTATPDHKDALIGFSDGLLAVAVATALELDRTFDAFEAKAKQDHSIREVTAAQLGEEWTTAVRRRDSAAKALAPIAGEDLSREAALRSATGTAETPDDLARGLRDLATLARQWIADPALAEISELTRVNAGYTDRLDSAADALLTAADAARTRMTFRVSQGDLDVLDGKNMYILKLIVDVFDEAHVIDPSIPRLIPIALAHVFKGKGRAKKSDSKAGSDGSDDEDDDTGSAG